MAEDHGGGDDEVADAAAVPVVDLEGLVGGESLG